MNKQRRAVERLMQPKMSLQWMLAIIAVFAVALAIWRQGCEVVENRRLRDEKERLTEEVAQLKFDLEIARIDTFLKVPTEALYQDHVLRGELNRVRWEALKRLACDDFVPVYGLYDHSPDSPNPSYFRSDRGLEHWKNFQGSFWDGYGINHADDGMRILNGKLKGSEDFYRRLMSDHELRDDYLKPLLMRFVRSTDQRSQLAAVEAMLLLGDRRPEVLEVIRDNLERLSGLDSEYARGLAGKYRSLIDEHNLRDLIIAPNQLNDPSTEKRPTADLQPITRRSLLTVVQVVIRFI